MFPKLWAMPCTYSNPKILSATKSQWAGNVILSGIENYGKHYGKDLLGFIQLIKEDLEMTQELNLPSSELTRKAFKMLYSDLVVGIRAGANTPNIKEFDTYYNAPITDVTELLAQEEDVLLKQELLTNICDN